MQSVVNGNITFGTNLGYRNGGSCGIKQKVLGLSLWKFKSRLKFYRLYICQDNSNHYCHNTSRISISYQGKGRSNFQLMMSNLSISDNGIYKVRIGLSEFRCRKNRFFTIAKYFKLKVLPGMFYMKFSSFFKIICIMIVNVIING